MPTLEDGQRFERYRIHRWLGSGVSSESYEAEDTILQRKVTLKLIHPWAQLPDHARRQYFREMQGISLLNHQYLASILDYGEVDGRLYIARRYVTNASLLSKEGRSWYPLPLKVEDAITYGHQLAQALQYIHNQGFLHGSITLTNILVLRGPNNDNEPDYAPFLLADIGLANFVRRFGQPPTSQLPITTAPEQLGKRVTNASDQFALAVIIYLWLAGRPPYLGSPEEIEHQKLSETITSLSVLNPKVSVQQEMVIRHALATYPEERYPSVLAFADALLATIAKPAKSEPPLEIRTVRENGNSQEVHQQTSTQSMIEFKPIPQTDPSSILGTIPHTDPDLMFELEPVPQPEPDIIQPIPEPVPAPDPLPETEETHPTKHTQHIEHLPESLPTIEPDIPDPLHETFTAPEAITMIEVSTETQQNDSQGETPQTPEALLEIEREQNLSAPPVTARLIINGPELLAQREILLENAETTIGRAGDSQIFLNDASISRHHALLKRENDLYILYDQRSVTGVSVNGQKLTGSDGYVLGDRDLITMGHFELTFRYHVSSDTEESSPVILDANRI